MPISELASVADPSLWTASSVVDVPAETFSPGLSLLLFVPHLAAAVLLVAGLWLSWRRDGKRAVGSYVAGIAVGAAGFAAVVVAKQELRPATTATYAYAYTGDRLTTVVYDGSGIRSEDTTDGRIVSCRGVRLDDGRMLVLARFDNGKIKQMTVAEKDVGALLSMLAEGRNLGKSI